MRETNNIIAFIPVRGGSKSLPLKNIKELYGKPLVCWVIEALENCDRINKIVIATDSDLIEETVRQFNYKKIEIYRRLSQNATDTSSTESVMLEYLDRSSYNNDDIMILVQATSPLTRTEDFENALNLYYENKYDSLLTCVRFKRFFWDENGISKNYDYNNRPRRQEFKGELMENGAFYINRVGNVKKFKNRLSGEIGIYEMPEYTSIEIDEPDDWQILENLATKYSKVEKMRHKVKLFLTDVDGVLTDGGMYYSEKGDELKKFNTRDGMTFQLFRNAGIKTGIITSEDTKIVEARAKKVKSDYLYQGEKNGGKLLVAQSICKMEGITMDEVAYVGDDHNCYELLRSVGFAFCPSDAVDKIKGIKSIIKLKLKGGEGVLRECYDMIINHNKTI